MIFENYIVIGKDSIYQEVIVKYKKYFACEVTK